MHSFYVDDLLTFVASEQEAIDLYEDLRKICGKGVFNLTKWISNNRCVLAAIPEEKRAMTWTWTKMSFQWREQLCAQSDTFGFFGLGLDDSVPHQLPRNGQAG